MRKSWFHCILHKQEVEYRWKLTKLGDRMGPIRYQLKELFIRELDHLKIFSGWIYRATLWIRGRLAAILEVRYIIKEFFIAKLDHLQIFCGCVISRMTRWIIVVPLWIRGVLGVILIISLLTLFFWNIDNRRKFQKVKYKILLIELLIFLVLLYSFRKN